MGSLDYKEPSVVEYYDTKETLGSYEYFKVAVHTTGGLEYKEFRYKWFGDKLYKETRDEIRLDLYDDWTNLVEKVNSEYKNWKNLKWLDIDKGSDFFDVTITGYELCDSYEIANYNKYQEQVPQSELNKKEAALTKIKEAQREVRKLVILFKNKFGDDARLYD